MIEVFKVENIDSIYNIFSKNELIKKHLPLEKNVKEYSQKIKDKGFLLVASVDKKMLGFVCGYANDTLLKKAFVSFLFIEKTNGFQNAIVINKLFCECQKLIRENGMNCIRAEVYDDNDYAMKIYKNLGFVEKEKAGEKSHYIELVL